MTKQTLKNIFFSILFFIILLILIELTLRIVFHFIIDYDIEMYKYSILLKRESVNQNLIFEHIPNTSVSLMGVNVQTDQYGMRNIKRIDYKKSTNFKVLCLGNSMTFGWGVPEEDTYVYKLEEKFKSSNITFINAGVGNYNLKMFLESLKQNFDIINPDCVLLTYCVGDARIIKKDPVNFITNNSYFYAVLYINFKKILHILKYKGKDISYYYQDIYNSDAWNDTKSYILDIRNFCLNKKVPLFVAIFPDFHEHKNDIFINIYSKVSDFMNKNNIPNVKIYDFYNKNLEDNCVNKDDSHPNATAHKIISDIIYDFLLKENFISVIKSNKN